MKKAIFIFMMTLAGIGTVSATELKLECNNESLGITKCSIKANLEGSKKIQLDYNFDSGVNKFFTEEYLEKGYIEPSPDMGATEFHNSENLAFD